jgi:hypothetical protein
MRLLLDRIRKFFGAKIRMRRRRTRESAIAGSTTKLLVPDYHAGPSPMPPVDVSRPTLEQMIRQALMRIGDLSKVSLRASVRKDGLKAVTVWTNEILELANEIRAHIRLIELMEEEARTAVPLPVDDDGDRGN